MELHEEFVRELRRCADDFGLTASDFALWFDQPRPTVRTWLIDGRAPRDGRLTECMRRLKLVRTCGRFPMPWTITARFRRTYLQEAYKRANDGRVSQRHPAR